MRKLQSSDVFNALRVIKKAGIKSEIKPVIATVAKGGMSIEDVGIEGVLTVIEIFAEKKSEQAIYDVLAGPFEMEPKDVEKLELDDLIDKLQQLASENDLKRYFTVLAGMIGKK